MSVCPNCHAATPPDAATCPSCGRALAATANGAGAAPEPELPAWLRELKPPAPADETPATAVPVPAAPAGGAPPARVVADAAPRAAGQLETSALISEDDLPGWLRTWAANEDAAARGAAQDQSWMLGGEEADGPAEADVVEEAPQAWHVPAAVTEPPPSRAATAFGVPKPETRAVERLLAPRPVEPEPAPEESRLGARLAGQAATPPMPLRRRTQLARSRSRAAALATAALATAAVVFLVSLVFFLVTVGPLH
ncbi:MAG TPA: zinc ribbon domain-containing protein [Thermomicrobiales bacterium]|nr:zinc ribbon domain-containing protein [Thermomicrobiales bacterium]